MQRSITKEDSKKVLALLQRIDAGYVPTARESQELCEIEEADFSNFELSSLPGSINRLSKLSSLDLSHNNLESLPEEIGDLTHLIGLTAYGNDLTSLPESISKLSQLTKLNLFSNQFTDFPECILKLSRLVSLDLSYNYLTALPENICDLFQLEDLDLSNNQLHDLPESIGACSQLDILNLSHNQMTRLPVNVNKLTQLIDLDLSHNQLTDLPEGICNLPELFQLDIARNQFTAIPEAICGLTDLRDLNISGNGITVLPKWLREMKSLRYFSLGDNPIEVLPDWLGDMKQITFLSLPGLNIQEFPHWIRQLSKLSHLYIGGNPLKTLPDWLGEMPKLCTLSLLQLQLAEFPRSLLNLNQPFYADSNAWLNPESGGILIYDTKLTLQPVSLFDQSRDRSPEHRESRKLIEDYFNAPKIPIREAKVIFLGDGKVGKTYTIQRLLHDCRKGDYPTKETHGILIEDLYAQKDGQTYKIRVWDFGGQDIMHEMHRCFLTDRTCYVVMIDTRSDKQTGRARYWLRTVQSIAPNAPVLLLVNEISGGQNRDLDYNTLKREFSNLVDVKYCSSLDASDEEFRQKVERAIFEQALCLDSCKMYLPESWEQVHQNLLRKKDTAAYYIDRGEFHNLCDQCGVPSDDGLRAWLLTWFNDLGVCFSYHLGEDGQEQSTDYKILDPMWLTSAVYKIIWEKERNDDGLIPLSEIYRILEKPGSDAMKKDGIPCLENVSYNQAECGYVLDIMRMFCISYPADENTEFMPTLCKTDSKLDPTPATWKQHAAYRFHYTFLPESVLHRLMIYCFANLRPGKRWRKGFWLECEPQGLSAVIRTTGRDSDENVLQIDVYAQKEQYEAWTWLQPLCQQISTINHDLSLKYKISILAENEEEKTWFPLDDIWYWKKKGVATMQGRRAFFQIQSLMMLIYGKFYPEAERSLMEEQDMSSIYLPLEDLSQAVTFKIAERSGLDLSVPFQKQLLSQLERTNDLQRQVIDALNCQTAATRQNTQAELQNTSAVLQNAITLQEAHQLLEAMRDGRVTLPAEVIDVLTDTFEESDETALQSAAQELKGTDQKTKGQRFRDFLGDAANLATIAPILIKAGNTYGPYLLELLRSLPPV